MKHNNQPKNSDRPGSMHGNKGKTGGLRKENPQRGDMTSKPNHHNPYPNGLS